jgi:hypothetical protein
MLDNCIAFQRLVLADSGDMLVFNPTHLSTIGRPPSTRAVNQHVRHVVDLFMAGMVAR